VYDVVVAGISLVTNYRDQFGQEVRNGGIDGLIASIANKNKSLEANQKNDRTTGWAPADHGALTMANARGLLEAGRSACSRAR
jgi:hypothetical protein